jgi:hypothetical protein
MLITQQPGGSTPGLPLHVQPQVYVADVFGNWVETAGSIKASLISAQADAPITMLGNANISFLAGWSQYTDLDHRVRGALTRCDTLQRPLPRVIYTHRQASVVPMGT